MTNQLNNIIRPRFTRIRDLVPDIPAPAALADDGLRQGHPLSTLPGRRAERLLQGDRGRPACFLHKFLTFDQFNWMDYASFSMTGKVHVEVTCLVSQRKPITCNIRPLAYGIQPEIEGNTASFDLHQPRYLIIFFNDEPAFNNTGLMLFAEPPEKNPVKLGDANVVNIQGYKVQQHGQHARNHQHQPGHHRHRRQARRGVLATAGRSILMAATNR